MEKKQLIASILLVMKVTILQIALAAICCFSVYANKGEAQVLLNKTVTISAKENTLAEVLVTIQKQTGVKFIFSAEGIQVDRKVNFVVKNKKLLTILSEDLKALGIGYSIVDDQVLLFALDKDDDKTAELLSYFNAARQKKITITGHVLDDRNVALPNVSIQEKGTTNGVTSKEDGSFEIDVEGNSSVLMFSFVGFLPQEVAVTSRHDITVNLQNEASKLGEVVVIGYGTQKKATLTGSVSSITAKELKTATNANVANMLAGKLPGFRVTQRNSEPGSYATDFDIRGFGSPLMIIDGVPRDNFTRLDPNEIESVSILKDASAAVYGVKAANGVLLITTKRGKSGKTDLTYSGTFGWASIANSPDVMNAYEYATLINESDFNTGKTTPTYSQDALQKFKDGTTPSTDWYGLVVRDRAPQMQHNLSASGGTDKIKYFMSLGYYDEQGIWKSGDLNYKRYNFRSNINAQITKNLDAELLINGISDKKMEPGEPTWVVFKSMWMQIPTIPVYANNNPAYLSNVADGTHPLAVTNADISGYNQTATRTFQGTFALNYKIPFVDGLKARGLFSYDSKYMFTKNWRKQFALYDYDNATDQYRPTYSHSPSNMSEGFDQVDFTTLQASLNYDKRFGKHNVKGLLLFEKLNQKVNNFNASREFSLDAIDQLYAGNDNNTQAGSSSQSPGFSGNGPLFDYVREGVVGRFNYDYEGKYLIEGSFRYDGSSKFAEGHRWGFFPAVSGGWRISEEGFFRSLLPVVNNLKLRASYGKLGDDASSAFQYLTGYNYPGGSYYMFGSSLIANLTPRGMANPNLTWYTSQLTDIGLDMDFFHGKLHAEFDVFQRRREGLLATRVLSLPGTVGAGLPQENLNSDMQHGFELLLSHSNKVGNVLYNLSGNVSFTRSKNLYVERAASNNSYRNWRDNNNDRWSDTYWGYHVLGQFQSMDEIKNSPVQDGDGNRKLLPGDLKYEDLNKDGVIDDNDVKPIGRNSPTPEVNFGFTIGAQWHGFDVNMLFQGAANFTVDYLGSDQLAKPLPWGRNGLAIFTDRWHKADMFDTKSDAWIPGKYPSTRPNGSAPWNYLTSDFWLHDATYLRLKSVEIGYTIPAKLLNKIGIKAFRVYANGFNLFTWSGLNSVVDPEHTKDTYGYQYPITKNYNLGLNITF